MPKEADSREGGELNAAHVANSLRTCYGAPGATAAALHLLSCQGQKRIYLLRQDSTPGSPGPANDLRPPLPWVVRAYASGRRPDGARSQAAVLRFLEERGYPAPRVVPALDGAPVTAFDGGDGARPVLVTTYVPGAATRLGLAALRAHGDVLGRLHALPVLDDLAAPGFRPAGMLPRNELAAALAWLAEVREGVPRALWPRYDALESACHALDRLEDRPRVLIHNDCHPWNSVRAPGGWVTLIDWEGAGLGPAIVDVGFLLLSADTGGTVGPVIAPDPARLDAVIEGYRRRYRLSEPDLERLPGAIQFRTLVGACASFARAVRRGLAEDDEPWWWQRYLLAGDLAGRARERFLRLAAERPPSRRALTPWRGRPGRSASAGG